MTAPVPEPVTVTEIADLTAWARPLAGNQLADPAEVAAYLTAKADLLERIADERAHGWTPREAIQARQVAEQARAAAEQAAARTCVPGIPRETR
jgi:hypothetical protein